jgi:hypothetical protein
VFKGLTVAAAQQHQEVVILAKCQEKNALAKSRLRKQKKYKMLL